MTARTRGRPAPDVPIISLVLRHEADVVLARQRARLIAELLGFGPVDQTRIATAISEISRNAIQHGGGGRIRFAITGETPRHLKVNVEDSGGGLPGLLQRLADRRSTSGGVGVELSRRLMDEFTYRSLEQGGTVVEMLRTLPRDRQETGVEEVRALVDELLRRPPESLMEELHQQQQELLTVLENLTEQQDTLRQVNAELEETNRGVMALYAEVTQELDDTNRGVMALYAQLDDQARELRHVNFLKDRFLSHLSHEFRTPLNSALALSRLLLDRADGPLTEEQERQVGFIHQGAGELIEMVNDLLDLAKIEAGRLDVSIESFPLEDLFSALRGMLRPLAVDKGLDLVFEDPEDHIAPLRTDQQKVAQILRNLISNAIKFTEAGEIRVGARARADGIVVFDVRDPGIGIPQEQIDRIFEEFGQVPGPHQRHARGTGLGLPLSARLAALLSGRIEVESTPGVGSTFRLLIPRALEARESVPATLARAVEQGDSR
jgi:signal transduction histidine kinase